MDRGKQPKDGTPPPLLLMPAGTGLTLDHTPGDNILMPVINADGANLSADETLDFDAEPDSFLGQSPPGSKKSTPAPSSQTNPFGYFSKTDQTGSADPFANLGSGKSPPHGFQPNLHSTPLIPPTQVQLPSNVKSQTDQVFGSSPMVAPPSGQVMPSAALSSGGHGAPLVAGQTSTLPQQLASHPPTSSQSMFRLKEKKRYVPPPDMTGQGQFMTSLPDGQVVPPTYGGQLQQFSGAPPLVDYPSTQQMAPPQGFTLPPQSSVPPPVASVSPQQHVFNPGTHSYEPVRHHWFYCKKIELQLKWIPFSMIDSHKLEEAYGRSNNDGITVPTNGGRYDVSLKKRTRAAIYWDEMTTEVRRCSWFFKNEADNKFVPFVEEFSEKLEEEYKNTVNSSSWHRRLEFPGNEVIVMHSPTVIVNFKSQPDEWGMTGQEESRPRVVKRGCDDIEPFQEGEPSQIDHLVFFVHGIGPTCDLRFRGIVECVDDFRSTSLSLMQSHFKQYAGSIGRVEFIPVYWYNALHGEASGVDRKLGNITLKSISKLRRFTNDVLLDILFYTAPKYSQTIADTVTSEINRLYQLFYSRNKQFNGQVSIAGHSLGSLILFDMLSNQRDLTAVNQSEETPPTPPPTQELINISTSHSTASSKNSSTLATPDSTADQELTLEGALDKLGLNSYLEKFQQEQMDIESLRLCEESDIKEMGLPMGPRKKLLTFVKDQKEREAKRKQEQSHQAEIEQKARVEAIIKQQQLAQTSQNRTLDSPLLSSSSQVASVDYVVGLAGTGQPHVQYAQLDFNPSNFFALGSPIAMFLTVRGIEQIGEDFKFPTCPNFFHIFHPFDPVAYRIEPLINQSFNQTKPVLMPHHKGRKRLHLELKESLTRVGSDIKQRIIHSVKSTWSSINAFARAHRSIATDAVVEQEVENVLREMTSHDEKIDEISIVSEDDIPMGSLNQGRRVDYVLQEAPIESFNDYLFALGSHGCYWESEDTALMVLKEIYTTLGFIPIMPGTENKNQGTHPPPVASQRGPPSLGTSQAHVSSTAATPLVPGYTRPPLNPGDPPLTQPYSMAPPPPQNTSAGPPPLSGFVRK